MNKCQPACRQYQPAVRGARECRDSVVNDITAKW
jgi:hypothetical protein